ncbi:uncharacterized protein LOC143915855 [Arctopsyche grandis]|uniref:uncharacterized protein LOC143915855 n=1 Tax=Arctopsyche grandis TaxID=121162 RepID=UPI00406DA19F
MFYDLQLLKKGGRFYLCHLAASWPTQFKAVTNRTIRTCNFIDICEDLRMFVSTESSAPSRRFSLRLSVRLLMGLLILFQRKVDLLAYDVLSYKDLVKKDKPKENLPITKEKNKRNPLAVTLPELEAPLQNVPLDINLNSFIAQDISTITLTEVDQIVPPIVYENFGEENVAGDQIIHAGEGPILINTTAEIHAPPRNIPIIMVNDNLIVNETEINVFQDIPEIRIEIPPEMLVISRNSYTFRILTPNQCFIIFILLLLVNIKFDTSNVIGEAIVNDTSRQSQLAKRMLDSINATLESIVPSSPKRKKAKVQMINKKLVLSANYIRSRLIDNIEMRCEEPKEDIVWYGDIFHYKRLIMQPAFLNDGLKVNSVFSKTLCPLFVRNTITKPNSNTCNAESFVLRPKEDIRADTKVEQSMKASFIGNITNMLSPNPHQTLNLIEENLEGPHMLDHGSVSRNDTNLLQDSLKRLDMAETGEPERKRSKSGYITINRSDVNQTIVDVHNQPTTPQCFENIESRNVTMIENQMPPDVQFEENNQTLLENVNRFRNELSVESTLDEYKEQQKILSEFGDPHHLLVKIAKTRKIAKNKKLTLYDVTERYYESSMPVSHRQVFVRSFYSLLKLMARGYVKVEKKENSSDILNIEVNMEELKKLK